MRLNAPDKKILQQAGEEISRNFSHNYTINELAANAHMSASRFKTGFQCMYNQPVHRYILQKKLAFALDKIEEDELTLAQIAKQCGYRHTTNFIAAFKKQYGYTPGRAKPRS